MDATSDLDLEQFLKIIQLEICEDRERLLFDLTTKYAMTIRYQNLDMFKIKSNFPKLTATVLFDKLLLRKKGGMCYEICELNFFALKQLNYDVHRIRTFVYNQGNDKPPNELVTHNILFVKLNDKKFLIDTGFSYNAIRVPIQFSFKETEEKEIFPGEIYRLQVNEDNFILSIKIKEEYFKFYLIPKNKETNEPILATFNEMEIDYNNMMIYPKLVPIRDQQIKCGGITEDGRTGFFYNELEKFGKFVRFENGTKVEELHYNTLGDFLDALKNMYNFDIPEHLDRSQLLN